MTELPTDIRREIERRRTFAIISHPDAGKTTITEKLLLFANAIHMAGQVKAKRDKRFATSDWMELERQRGISVSSSVMQFEYGGCRFNLLDTPGHQDFSEDTYRTLTAVDSALMVIDSSKGIETQTKKLFQVCRDRHLPIITFMNKLDLEGRDPFELIDEVEQVLQLPCYTMTWPVGQGRRFAGVYDLRKNQIRLFDARHAKLDFEEEVFSDLDDPALAEKVEASLIAKLRDDLELLHGAGQHFDPDHYLAGEQSPVFFGSAVNNFGVPELLQSFVDLAPPPRSRPAKTREVAAQEKNFSGLVFKIQANMDPKHRDRCAFVRICSGRYEPGMQVHHVRLDRDLKLGHAVQFMSQERIGVEQAVAGDIIGLHDRGTFMIGDAITAGETLEFTGVPQFSPEIFSDVRLANPLKAKQLHKGLEQLAEEGTSQVFRRKYNTDLVLGVVGALQLEVVKFRLLHEYGADANFSTLPYTSSCWFHCNDRAALEEFERAYQSHVVYDVRGYPLMLFKSDWERDYVQGKYPQVRFFTSLLNYEQGLA